MKTKKLITVLSSIFLSSSLYALTAPSPELEELCEDDNPSACYMVAMNNYTGIFKRSDPEKAFNLFQKACDLGDNPGCLMLARYYYTGDGVEKDLKKSKDILYELCEDNSYKFACESLDEITEAEEINKKMNEEQKNLHIPSNATPEEIASLKGMDKDIYTSIKAKQIFEKEEKRREEEERIEAEKAASKNKN